MSNPSWRLTYLRSELSLYLVGIAFISLNILMLVVTARPHTPGTVPRYYWAVLFVGIIAFGTCYWGVLKALQGSIGAKMGFQVQVYEPADDDTSDSRLSALIREAVADGSHRRVCYKVISP